MARTYEVSSMRDLARLFAKHQRERERRVVQGVRKAVHAGVPIVKAEEPVAFGELREGTKAVITSTGGKVVVDSPHAAAAETGSRPHRPPIEPILAWVKLRGMQGLKSEKQLRQLPGRTTAEHARSITAQIHAAEMTGRGIGGPAIAVDVPMQIARAIQNAIAKHGTKPHWYARQSLPKIVQALDRHVRAELFRQE